MKENRQRENRMTAAKWQLVPEGELALMDYLANDFMTFLPLSDCRAFLNACTDGARRISPGNLLYHFETLTEKELKRAATVVCSA